MRLKYAYEPNKGDEMEVEIRLKDPEIANQLLLSIISHMDKEKLALGERIVNLQKMLAHTIERNDTLKERVLELENRKRSEG